MPIDFARIAAAASGPWLAASRQIAEALGMLGPLLAARLQRLSTLESRSRGFPVFAFEGTALSVRIHASQNGALRPYASTGDAFAAPFVAFGRGVAHVGQAAEDEMILPGLIDAVASVVDHIHDSIARLVDPRASTFDPRKVRFWDLFGLAVMAFRGLQGSTGQLRAMAGDVHRAVELFRGGTPGSTAAGGASAGALLPPAPAAPAMAPPSGLDVAGHWLVGAIALLPAIPGWLETLGRAAWLRARTWLLDTLQGVEARVFALRATVLRLFLVTLPGLLRDVPALVVTIGTMLQWNIQYFMLFAEHYFKLLIDELQFFFKTLTDYVDAIIGIINAVLGLIDRIMNFDLLRLVEPFMGISGDPLRRSGIRFTVNDLLDASGTAVNFAVKVALKGAILAARAAVHTAGAVAEHVGGNIPSIGPRIDRATEAAKAFALHKLDLLDQIVNALFRDTGPPTPETAGPVITPMPNFYDLLIGQTPQSLGQSLRSFGATLATQVRSLLDTLATTLDGFGAVFTRTAADVARTGPATRMPQFGREVAELSSGLFDDQIRELGDRIRATPVRSFEHWLATGGFEVVGAAIPLYIGEMRRYWHAQAESQGGPYDEITPTSPHILALRARLGRVRVPRLTLRADGGPMTEELAALVARQFRRAVRAAYATGQNRLQQIAAAAH